MIRKINGLYFLIMLTYSIVDKIYGTSYMDILYNSGLGIGLISIVLSAEDFMTMIFEYPSGIIADKMGRKRTTAIGMFILAVGYLLFIISKNFWFFVLAAFFKSLGVSLFSGSPQSWYYEELKKIDELKVREKSIPLLRSLINIVCIIVLGMCTLLFSVSNLFPMSIAIVLLIGVSLLIYIRGTDNYGNVSAEESLLASIFNNTKRIFSEKVFWKLAVYKILIAIPYCIFILCWQLIILEHFKQSPSIISIMMIVIMGVFSLSSFCALKLLKKYRLQNLMMLAIGMMAATCLGIFFARNLYVYLGLILLFEFALCMHITLDEIWVQDLIPSDNRASYFSALNAMSALANSILLIGLGFMIQNTNLFFGFIFASIVGILALIYYEKNYSSQV